MVSGFDIWHRTAPDRNFTANVPLGSHGGAKIQRQPLFRGIRAFQLSSGGGFKTAASR